MSQLTSDAVVYTYVHPDLYSKKLMSKEMCVADAMKFLTGHFSAKSHPFTLDPSDK